MEVSEIKDLLPHRYPFLLLDRVVEYQESERIVCIKNVTINEQIFNGHFPATPVFPGVLIVEALSMRIYANGLEKVEAEAPVVVDGIGTHLLVRD